MGLTDGCAIDEALAVVRKEAAKQYVETATQTSLHLLN
jgi:hypothetical protein